MTQIKTLHFKPFWGLSSNHLQMIVSSFIPKGKAPSSKQWLVDIDKGDKLSCEVSTPPNWKEESKTILLIHGLGGSHNSSYMIRIAQKLYMHGIKIVRINLRNCGSGKGLSALPYCAGNSADLFKVLEATKKITPFSEIYVVGFSLGGNIVLKLAGELGLEAHKYMKKCIAVCPPIDLADSVRLIEMKKHRLYLKYYLKNIYKQSTPWTDQKFRSIYEFDQKITAPLWGFPSVEDFYENYSSKYFLSKVAIESHVLFAQDDPFIDIGVLKNLPVSKQVHVWETKYGSHMGFLGRDKFHWLDHLLFDWIALKT